MTWIVMDLMSKDCFSSQRIWNVRTIRCPLGKPSGIGSVFAGISHYRLRAARQGCAGALRICTKLLRPLFGLFARMGMVTVYYLDNLIWKCNVKRLNNDIPKATYILENLGSTISIDKANFLPTRKKEFLGIVLDSCQMSVNWQVGRKTRLRF